MTEHDPVRSRREFMRAAARGACLLGLGGAGGFLLARGARSGTVWQLDPHKCIACGNCATYCVLAESAVKVLHEHAVCGYCQLCTAYFTPMPNTLTTAAENLLCPTGAIERRFVEDPYYEYKIDKALCIGCGKCVKGCTTFGNGSLFLQVCHDRCLNCNECSIAASCPAEAFVRVPAAHAYILKHIV